MADALSPDKEEQVGACTPVPVARATGRQHSGVAYCKKLVQHA